MQRDRWSFDLVVVGGGAAGLAAARAGVRRGCRTALVHDGRVGGECTFTGCVPSKTLIEAAGAGLSFVEAMAALHDAVETIAATESAEVLTNEGVEVLAGRGRFVAPRRISVGGGVVEADRVVVATGSAPAVPDIPGLEGSGYLTNESVFDLGELPPSLAVLGGGAVGCELAQAFRRFGSEVHLVEAGDRLLPHEEPEASAVVAGVFAAEGITLHLRASATRVARLPGGALRLHVTDGSVVEADVLLVAVGRRPKTADLGAEAAGIALDERGQVQVDAQLATSARGVFAAGDVTGRLPFTHAADEMGRLAVRNAFTRLRRRRFDPAPIPWVTFCDPEVARVGMDERQAARHRGRVAVLPMTAVDRAVTARRTEGYVKLLAGPRPLLGWLGGGRILGATVVGPRAGELINEVALAMATGMFTGRLAQAVHAYPTWSTALRQAAAQFFMETGRRRARPAVGGDDG